MTVQGFTDQGSTTADTLLAGEFPRVSELATITGGSYTRGTVLKASGDALTICSASDTPEAILAEAVDATSEDKQAVVYLTGEFNSAALTVASGASADGLKAKLRAKNIFIYTRLRLSCSTPSSRMCKLRIKKRSFLM